MDLRADFSGWFGYVDMTKHKPTEFLSRLLMKHELRKSSKEGGSNDMNGYYYCFLGLV